MNLEKSDYIRFAICGFILLAMFLAYAYDAYLRKNRSGGALPPSQPEAPWENGPDISEDDAVALGILTKQD